MNAKQIILAGCAVMALSVGAAQAGPCDMTGKSASTHDAGAGPTPGNTGQTTTGTGTGTSTNQHAANSTMNRAAGDVATSSQDAQKQMQAQPTAAQQAQGAKSTDQGC
jgi:type IV secretory pathway TrbL component